MTLSLALSNFAEVVHPLGQTNRRSSYIDARTHLISLSNDGIAPNRAPGGELDDIMWVQIADAVAASVGGTIRCATTSALILRPYAAGYWTRRSGGRRRR